jgi:hypothetical protein
MRHLGLLFLFRAAIYDLETLFERVFSCAARRDIPCNFYIFYILPLHVMWLILTLITIRFICNATASSLNPFLQAYAHIVVIVHDACTHTSALEKSTFVSPNRNRCRVSKHAL